MSNKAGTIVSLLLILVSITLLIASCAETPATMGDVSPEMILVTDSCIRISQYAYICEVSLRDGTRCAVVHTARYDGGAGIDCDWE